MKLICCDAYSFSSMIYPYRMHQVDTRLETSRKSSHLLIELLLKMPSSISLDEAKELWSFMVKVIKKRIATANMSHENQPEYWLLRQG